MKTLDPELIRRANDNSLSGSAGDAIARDMSITLGRFDEAFPEPEALEEGQRAYLSARRAQWEELVYSVYSDTLRRRAAFVSWAVAGPAGYNHARARKQLEASDRAQLDGVQKLSAFLDHTRRGLLHAQSDEGQVERYRRGADDPIAADDPLALAKLEARLDFLTREQEQMKRINAWVRRHGTALGCDGITAGQAQAIDEGISRRGGGASICGIPYPPYLLKNNAGNIRRIRDRIDVLRRLKASRKTQNDCTPESKISGAEDSSSASDSAQEPFAVTEDAQAMRLQIRFGGKPCEAARSLLRQNGFRWAPSRGAWQRQLTDNARHALARIRGQLAALTEEGSEETHDPA